jgi:hypothetical protein
MIRLNFGTVDFIVSELFDISVTDPESESSLYEFQKYHKSVIPYTIP